MKFTRRKAIIGGIVGAGFVGVGWWFARERDRLGDRKLFNIKPGETGLKIGLDHCLRSSAAGRPALTPA